MGSYRFKFHVDNQTQPHYAGNTKLHLAPTE